MRRGERILAFVLSAALMVSSINMPAVTVFAQSDETITEEAVTEEATATDAVALQSTSDDEAADATGDQETSVTVTEGQDFKVEYDEESGDATKSFIFTPEEDGNYVLFTPYKLQGGGYALSVLDEQGEKQQKIGNTVRSNEYMADTFAFEKGKSYTMEFCNVMVASNTLRIVKENKPVSAELSIDRSLPGVENGYSNLYIVPYIKASVTYADNTTGELKTSTLIDNGMDAYGNLYRLFAYTDGNSWQDVFFDGTVNYSKDTENKLAVGYQDPMDEDYTKLTEYKVSYKSIDEADLDTITEGKNTIYQNTWYKINVPYTATVTIDKTNFTDDSIFIYVNGEMVQKSLDEDTLLYKGVTYYMYCSGFDYDEALGGYPTTAEVNFTFHKVDSPEIILGEDFEVEHKDDEDRRSATYTFKTEEDGNYVLFTPYGYPESNSLSISVTDLNTADNVIPFSISGSLGIEVNTYELKKDHVYSILFVRYDSEASNSETFRLIKENKPVSAEITMNRIIPYDVSHWIYINPYVSLTVTYEDGSSKEIDLTKSENTSNDLIDEYGNFYCLFRSNADNVWNYGTFNGIIYSDESRIAVAYHDKKNDKYIKLGECNVIHKPIVEADLDTISVGQNTVFGSNWYQFTAPETGFMDISTSGIFNSEPVIYTMLNGELVEPNLASTLFIKGKVYYIWLEFMTEDGYMMYNGDVDIKFTDIPSLPEVSFGQEQTIDINSKKPVFYRFTAPEGMQSVLFNLKSDIEFSYMIYDQTGKSIIENYGSTEELEAIDLIEGQTYILSVKAKDLDATEEGVQGSCTCVIKDIEQRFDDLTEIKEGTTAIHYGDENITYKQYVFVPEKNGRYIFKIDTSVVTYTGIEDTSEDNLDYAEGTKDLTMNCNLEAGKHYRFYVELQNGKGNEGICNVSIERDIYSEKVITGLEVTGYDKKVYEIDTRNLKSCINYLGNGLHYKITYDDGTTRMIDEDGTYQINGVTVNMTYLENQGIKVTLSAENGKVVSSEYIIPFADPKEVQQVEFKENKTTHPITAGIGQHVYKFTAPVTGYYNFEVDTGSEGDGEFWGNIYSIKNLKDSIWLVKDLLKAGETYYVCIYSYNPEWKISITATPEIKKAATCEEAGIKIVSEGVEYEYGTEYETEYELKEETIPALGHDNIVAVTKATTKAAGKKVLKCSRCGKVAKTETIPAIKTVTLATASYTYDGKAKTPVVVVKGTNGKVIAASNYTVTGGESRTDAGTYKITVTFKNDYQGSSSVNFTIKKATPTLKVTANKEAITAGAAATLTVKGAKGTVSYTSSNDKTATVSKGKVTGKKAGEAVITVKSVATANYNAATAKITIKVKPKTTSISKVTSPAKGQIKVTWKKNTTGDAYEIQYSTSKKFTKGTTKTVKVSKNSTTSATIKKLSAGKKYYVRMRSTDKTGKLTSAWSTVKNVTTKKK